MPTNARGNTSLNPFMNGLDLLSHSAYIKYMTAALNWIKIHTFRIIIMMMSEQENGHIFTFEKPGPSHFGHFCLKNYLHN